MKYILSFKLFESESEKPFNVDDINKTELKECIDCFNRHFSKLLTDEIELDTYKDESVTTMDSYAYCARFSNEIVVSGNYDNIFYVLLQCLTGIQNDNSYLRLLNMDGSYDPNGYSLVFSNRTEFKTRLSRKSTKIKVPNERNKILISIICYIVTHLETMSDKISYLNDSKALSWLSASVFKKLIINYCEYLLLINRKGGNLFKIEISQEEVDKVVYNTIIHSENRYTILNAMRDRFPEYYNKISAGNKDSFDIAGDMGNMGFNENINTKSDSNQMEINDTIDLEMKRFNKMFNKIGIGIQPAVRTSSEEYAFCITFNYFGKGSIFKEFFKNLAIEHGLGTLNRVLPININLYSVQCLKLLLKPNPNNDLKTGYTTAKDSSGSDKYVASIKEYTFRNKELMNIFLKAVVSFLGNVNHNTQKVQMEPINAGKSSKKVEIPFLRHALYEYIRENLQNDYAGILTPEEYLYTLIYDEVVSCGTISHKYFTLMKQGKLYDKMYKLSNGGLSQSSDIIDMGFAD